MNEINFLKKILNIPSINGESNEKKLANWIYNYLKECGVSVEIQKVEEDRFNIVAKIKGENNGTFVWNGHLDTVSYGDKNKWITNPSEAIEKDGFIYCRGASDMKSGLAAMIFVLGTMCEKGIRPNKDIVFIGTCDEEKGGIGAKAIVKTNLLDQAECILIGEPTKCFLGLAQKGCIWIKIIVRGTTSHGAYPEEGANSIEFATVIFEKLKNYIVQYENELLGKSTAQITKLHGGIANNMTPDYAEMTMDIRITPQVNKNMIFEQLRILSEDLEKKSKGKIMVQWELVNHRIAIETSENNHLAEAISNELINNDIQIEKMGINYFTDASIFLEKWNVPVVLFGPGDPKEAHKSNEKLEIEQYLKYINIMKNIYINY